MKNNRRERAASLGRYAKIITGTVLAAMALIGAGQANAATLEATPNIRIKYNITDNLYANDPNELKTTVANDNEDLVNASYMDYLVGLTLAYRTGRSTFSVNGDVGFEQFLTLSGWIEDAEDHSPNDFNFVTIHTKVGYSYAAPKYTINLSDTTLQTRDLGQVFGAGTDALGYWSLYLDNIAMLGVTSQLTARLKTLFQYSYESMTFATPENNIVAPADTFENHGYFRSEYKFNSKAEGIVDIQGAARNFGETNGVKAADYNLLQGMIGIRYYFSPMVNVTALGGYARRTFSDLSDQRLPAGWGQFTGTKLYDLDDMSDPIGRITLVINSPQDNSISITALQGISTYGQNLFFNYTLYRADVVYHITPDLITQVSLNYRQAFYDRAKNGREWDWSEDRKDNITYVTGLIHWDILKKHNQGTLMAEAGIIYQNRDSNIDSNKDYTPEYQAFIPVGFRLDSFDAVVTTYYVSVQIVPTLLFGR